ncbi:MAG TPA: hypothetical protein VK638_36700 [Edaphobacter sp.]|nr:hypothetical protein [Edaphobacter sp.]
MIGSQRRPELAATKAPSAIDIAWSAGIYEGEGTCRNTCKTKTGFMLSVVQKDPELLYRLRDWFGGSVRLMGSGVYTWDACGDRARVFMGVTYPFFTARRKAQVDATGALVFFGCTPQSGLTVEEVQARLTSFNTAEKSKTWLGGAGSARAKERYRIKCQNPVWVAQQRQKRLELSSRKEKAQRNLFAIA